MVDLDSNPTKLFDIVEIGKQLLMTRGALTTFSIANDVAKYFAIIPAIFGALYCCQNRSSRAIINFKCYVSSFTSKCYPKCRYFQCAHYHCFNPLALRGVHYRAQSAYDLLETIF